MIVTTETPKDLSILEAFNTQHPTQLRWPKDILEKNIYNTHAKYFWLINDNNDYVGQLIFGWVTKYKEVIVDSFTILPKYQGRGLGKTLIKYGIEWAESECFINIIGAARQGASIRSFLSYGAIITDVKYNWCNTGENYLGFDINLKINDK